ncbi:MAG: hypothetical protein Q9180_003521 [Flavoplaca navasiana]
MLMWHDLVKAVAPGRSGKRPGNLMLENIKGFIQPNTLGIDPEKIASEIRRWSLIGWKLNVFCDAFGPGALIHLGHVLTMSFIENKFTASGKPHDEAFAHLRSLDLGAVAKNSGADALGHNIRQLLMAPFESQDAEGSDDEDEMEDSDAEATVGLDLGMKTTGAQG